MSKRKAGKPRTSHEAPTALVRPVPVPPTGVPPVPVEPAEEGREVERYAFPTAVRCPRCGTFNSVATATRGRVQYRRCRNPSCLNGDPSTGRGSWKIIGDPA